MKFVHILMLLGALFLVLVMSTYVKRQTVEHFDSALMVEMAKSCKNILVKAPEIELFDSLSAHDLA